MGDSKKTKLPKRIAGVKLPKKMRKKANQALSALDQPIVRTLASAAFAAAASAASKHADEARQAAEAATKKAGRAKTAKPAEGEPEPAAAHNQMADVAAGLALAAITKWLATRDKPADDSAKPATSPASSATH